MHAFEYLGAKLMSLCRLAMSPRAAVDMHNKTVLITGSTDGIGRHTAQRLAQDGATVLVHGRNAQKAQAAADSIRKATGNENCHAFAADLASHKQVRRLGQEVKAAHPELYALVNNAGIFAERMQKSEDGYELTWVVNVQAPFLLTSILLDNVTNRIVNVSSISAGSNIDFDNLNQEKGFSSHNSYGLSKLAIMCFTRDLASIVEDRGVTANCLDPGTVNTKMLYIGWGPCGIDLKDANDEYWMITSPELERVNGKYFVGRRPRSMPRCVEDVSIRKRLWQTLEQETGAKYPKEPF